MAIGINSGLKTLNPYFLPINNPNSILSSKPFLPISKNTQHKKVSASITNVPPPSCDEVLMGDSDCKKNDSFSVNTDSWMQDSVADIIKNLKQAPLLVHVYSENERLKLKTEKAFLDEWKSQESKSPDGLIFVKELEPENVVNQDCEEEEEGENRVWGVIVQGKGVDCGSPACYMLKTNCVCGGMGLGFSTHFCLMRVKNFRDSAFEQFKDSWLLQ